MGWEERRGEAVGGENGAAGGQSFRPEKTEANSVALAKGSPMTLKIRVLLSSGRQELAWRTDHEIAFSQTC